MAKVIYFHIWDNHFKMWGYETYRQESNGNIRIIFYWGKIADSLQRLQQKEKTMPHFDACDLVKKKIDEKLRKGYVPVPNVIYSQYSCGKISLYQLIKQIEGRKELL